MSTFARYRELIADPAFKLSGQPLASELRISSERGLVTYYAPFDHVNRKARIAICGITPGLQQAMNALNEARRQLQQGASDSEALAAAKVHASFSGRMRPNLVNMLDHIGVNRLLGIETCNQLFGNQQDLAHFTSALRNPVFLKGTNYNGAPAILGFETQKAQITEHLAAEVSSLGRGCIFVPLGGKVSEVFKWLEGQGVIHPKQVLHGLPHPSPASAERINYFLGLKPQEALSLKTNGPALDAAKQRLIEQIADLS
ncbi:TPA: hypothetical protein ACP32N_003222 [Pseudomonas aeruginosa]